MKKIGLILGALVVLLTVSCNDMLLQKDANGISVSFMAPGGSNRAGATNNWNVNGWLELEDGTRLQQKEMTVPASAPISLTFTEVAIGTKLRVRVDLVDSENSLIKYTGSSNLIEVNAQNVNVTLTLKEVIVGAANPTITSQPESQTKAYEAGNEVNWTVTLTVEATSPDGGNLSYQWHESSTNSNTGGNLIPEATKTDYQVSLVPGETKYFYCVVTNTNDAVNGTKSATATTNVAEIVYDRGVYGQVSGVLLWDTQDKAWIATYGKYESPASLSDTQSEELSFDANRQVYCFDKNGNLYVLPSSTTTVSDVLKFEIQSDFSYKAAFPITTGGQVFSYLAYDNAADVLYGIGEKASLHCCKSGETSFTEVQGSTVNGGSYLGLAVHDNVVYTIENGGEAEDFVQYATLRSYSISFDASGQATSSLKHEKTDSFLMPSFCTGSQTGQMIYQDGALYLLLGRVEITNASNASTDSPAAHYSLGALAKINPNALTLDTSFGSAGFLGLSAQKQSFSDLTQKDGTPVAAVDFYGDGEESSVFYGPAGFVAVIPKKLVIADAGFAMSTGDDSKVNLTKKTRVVTVDLESQAFSTTDVDAGYYQSNDSYSSISSQTTGYSYIVITN